jgi:hypothetical protein
VIEQMGDGMIVTFVQQVLLHPPSEPGLVTVRHTM